MTDSIAKSWNRFFHATTDGQVYAVLRMGVSTCLLIYAIVLAPNWLLWFSDSGIMSQEAGKENIDPDTWSLLNLLPASPAVLWSVFGIFSLQSLLLLLGWKSRVQVVCLFIWILSFHHRNNLIWEGGDVLLRLTLFLMMFMPLGAKWSLDNLGKRAPHDHPIWPLKLLQLQQSLLYLSSVLRKLQGEDWVNGTALYYAFRLDEFSGRIGTFRLSSDFLWIYQSLTWLAIAIECLLIFGVWAPSIRRKVVIIGLFFHLSLELSMNLFLFQWLMILILSTHLIQRPRPFQGVGASSS